MSSFLSKKPHLVCAGLAADDIMPREIWNMIAMMYPAAWTRLSLVVPAVAADACDSAKRAALMLHFTDADGLLPNGAKHGMHVCNDRIEHWWMGELHRDTDHPAVIHANGTLCWYQHGKRHRGDDKPAVVNANGTQLWFQHGVPYQSCIRRSNFLIPHAHLRC